MILDTGSVVSVLQNGKVFDLGQPLESGMPCSPSHPGFRMALIRRHGDRIAANGQSGANELIVTGGHVGTHIDALCHAAIDGRMFGGVDAAQASVGGRFNTLGIETVAPLITRGVLADVPALKGVGRLEAAYGITETDLAEALAGIDVTPGDVVLVRSGWPQLYGDADAYLGVGTGVPGITERAAEWLADRHVRAVGSDTVATDQILPGLGHSHLPAHVHLLVERGIHIIEVMNLEALADSGVREFILLAIPLKIVGGTGSPIRPLAIAIDSQP